MQGINGHLNLAKGYWRRFKQKK